MSSAILFDFNGVIIDDEPQHCDALIATLAEYGRARS
jgi:beta-phosphoglucomutase-like phosphatase (HAD superfamily)